MLLKMIKQIPKKISLIIKVSSQLSLFSERLFNLGLGWVGLGWFVLGFWGKLLTTWWKILPLA